MSAYVGRSKNLKDPKAPAHSYLSGCVVSALRKEAWLFGFFLREGKVSAYVERNQKLKDLKDLRASIGTTEPPWRAFRFAVKRHSKVTPPPSNHVHTFHYRPQLRPKATHEAS